MEGKFEWVETMGSRNWSTDFQWVKEWQLNFSPGTLDRVCLALKNDSAAYLREMDSGELYDSAAGLVWRKKYAGTVEEVYSVRSINDNAPSLQQVKRRLSTYGRWLDEA